MKRKALAAIMAVAMAVSMAGCGGSTSESKDSTQKTETADSTASTGGSVENKDKPLCWFNRQPSSSATGSVTLVQHYPKTTPVIFWSLSILISLMTERQSVRFSSRVKFS